MEYLKAAFKERCEIHDTDDCIFWIGNFDKAGYGRIHLTRKTIKAHRLSYCIFAGIDISEISGLVVMHSCDNPSCVNPRHLSIGTQIENVIDRFSKGRCAKGVDNGFSKLTIKDVDEIRSIYSKQKKGFGSICLGKKYGVHHSTILRVVNGELWK